jgi:hypothetical protein
MMVSIDDSHLQYSSDPFADLITGFPDCVPSESKPDSVVPLHYLPSHLPWSWLTRADALGGSALAVGLIVFRNRSRTAPTDWPNRVGLEAGEPLGIGRRAVRLALTRLAETGLIEVESRLGRKAVVKIIDVPTPNDKPQFIFPRIPLDWIGLAARCPSPGLLLGLAAWRFGHMTREQGVSRFRIAPLEGSTRSTASLRLGLAGLEKAGLIERLEAPTGFARLRIVR